MLAAQFFLWRTSRDFESHVGRAYAVYVVRFPSTNTEVSSCSGLFWLVPDPHTLCTHIRLCRLFYAIPVRNFPPVIYLPT